MIPRHSILEAYVHRPEADSSSWSTSKIIDTVLPRQFRLVTQEYYTHIRQIMNVNL